MSLFDELDQETEEHKILRVPFGYPGGKTRSVKFILPHLPYKKSYVEPFGGSAAVLLSRHKSLIEVFNDRYAGVVCFYKCIRDKNKFEKLCDKIELSLHSREDWYDCHDTWENVEDEIERAYRWYYMTVYSFGQIGRNFGRATTRFQTYAGKLRNKLELLPDIHERFKTVQVENQDWYDCIKDYDSPDTVFYIDPPYVDTHSGAHKHIMTHEQHRHLLDVIFSLQGFAAVSGYSNPLYENRDWDERYEWESFASIESTDNIKGNSKENISSERKHAKEVLWLKL